MAEASDTPNRANRFLSSLFFMFWSILIAKWPDILTNLISNLFYDILKFALSDWIVFLIFLFIVISIIFGIYSNAKKHRKAHPNNVLVQGMYEKQILMQSSMFSLSSILSYFCIDFCKGLGNNSILSLPFSNPLLALLAAIAPIIGGGIAHEALKEDVTQLAKLAHEVSKFIDDKLRSEQRIDQRILVDFVRDFVQENKVVLPDKIEDWVRLQLFLYYEGKRYKRVTDVFIEFDTLREPENWKIIKGKIRPTT